MKKDDVVRTVSVRIASAPSAALDELQSLPQYSFLPVNTIMNLGILALLEKEKNPKGIVSVQAEKKDGRGRPRTKPSEEELKEQGIGLCDALDGAVQGGSCAFTKYEITAGGDAVSYGMTLPFNHLTQETVDKQYDVNEDVPRAEAKRIWEAKYEQIYGADDK